MRVRSCVTVAVTLVLVAAPFVFPIEGDVATHDPSTVVMSEGKYYTFWTGTNIPFSVSDDGYTWRRGGSAIDRIPESVRKLSPANDGTNVWAPDIIKLNNQYYLYYSVSSWGQFASAVGLLTSPTLDQQSPDYKWTDRGPVVWSDGKEALNAIDPGVFHDPNSGRLWLTYGSYHGTVRLVELDPKTGLRVDPDKPATVVASRSESSVIIYQDGWYYLFTNHGSCCQGATSTYNLRVGRSKDVTGPYMDDRGVDMARGGGKLFLASGDRKIGPGHFGLLDLGDGVQKFSCHYECDLDQGGPASLDIRPLFWREGWPVAGANLKDGTFQIRSIRSGTIMEVAVEGRPVYTRGGRGGRGRGGRGGQAGAGATSLPVTPPPPPVATAPATMPSGEIDLRMAAYLLQDQQKWTVSAVPGAGGTPGSPYFKITLATNGRAVQAGANGQLVTVDSFTGGEAQLWRIDQLIDGSFRIMSKGSKLALTAGQRNRVELTQFSVENDNQKWELLAP